MAFWNRAAEPDPKFEKLACRLGRHMRGPMIQDGSDWTSICTQCEKPIIKVGDEWHAVAKDAEPE
jgi:hypothetical protein